MPSPPLSIVQSLSPRVAVLSSDDVADSCAANGCHGLDELLRPWEGGTERVQIMSSQLTPTVHPTFPLRFVSYASVYANPATATPSADMVVDLISTCVGRHAPEDEQHYPITRALLLASRGLTPHETFNHPVGVLLAISTSTPDPLGTLKRLHGQAVATGAQAAPWMDGVQVLKFYVVVHDVSKKGEGLDEAKELLAAVKKAYGPHSTLLVINSAKAEAPPFLPPTDMSARETPDPPDMSTVNDPGALSQLYASTMANLALSPVTAAAAHDASAGGDHVAKRYATKLTGDDVQRLVALVRELVVQSLVPWMEARVREWNEAYQSNRRGITGRLFGAGRKLFGSRPSSPSPAGSSHQGYNIAKGYYPVNSIEGLSRRLADFAFMLRDYRYAAGVYDSLRRDYTHDRAWRYASAATEMVGLAQLLSQTFFLPNTPPNLRQGFTTLQHTEISSWLEQAVIAYQARGGVALVQLDALRVTVLYYEAWKAINEWRGVGAALVRSAGEADEVPCAVIIEEAAAADVRGGKSMRGRRRQAFHLVMAARRYEKTGLKTFSRRCLERAAGMLRHAPWGAVRDRVEYSLGRQAYTLGESDVAVAHFLRLLERDDTATPGTQSMVLEDLALAYDQLAQHPDQLAAAQDKLQLPTPVFDVKKTRVVLAAEGSSSGSRDAWAALDARTLAHWDRKGKKPMSVLPDTKRIVAAIGEEFTVELTASNPLNAPVVLQNLTLNVDGDGVDVETVPEITLEPYETRQVAITVTPRAGGTLAIKSARFMFHRFLPCVQSLERQGRRLHATRQQRITPTYADDHTLTVHVEGDAPRVVANLVGVPESVFAGEIVDAKLWLRNVGTLPVEDVQLTTSRYGVVTLPPDGASATVSNAIHSNHPFAVYGGTIAPGAHVSVPVRFSAQGGGRLEVLALAVFSTPDGVVGAARLSHTTDVRRVISVVSDVRPAKDGYFVTVDVASHADVPLQLAPASPVSQYWRADVLGPTDAVTLYPNQTVRSVLSVRAGDAAGLDLSQAGLVANLGRLVRGAEPSDLEAITPATVTLPHPPADGYMHSRRAFRLGFAAANFSALPTDVVPKVLPMFDPLDLDVAYTWTASGGDRRGFAAAHGIRPAPAFSLVEGLRDAIEAGGGGAAAKRTMFEETGRIRRALAESVLEGVYADEGDPVYVRAAVAAGAATAAKTGTTTVTHFFGPDGTTPLLLPVTITLQNRSPAVSARWILRLPAPRHPAAPAAPLYAGQLVHRGTLAPGAAADVVTSVYVPEPGLVQLGGWEVERETGDVGDTGAVGAGVADTDVNGVPSDTATPAAAAPGVGDASWAPRASWSAVGAGPLVEVVAA